MPYFIPESPRTIAVLCLVVLAGGVLSSCEGSYLRPSGEPAKMSGQTVCYRAHTLRGTAEAAPFVAEVISRNLDCNALLASDPLTGDRRY